MVQRKIKPGTGLASGNNCCQLDLQRAAHEMGRKGERVWTRLGRAESVEEEEALQSNVGIKQSEDYGELDPWMLCFFHFLPTPALGPNLQPGII
jgi:hypothetical protein